MNIGLVFGDQLWYNNPILEHLDKVIIVESYDYSRAQKYHKLKLAYAFTMMREYADALKAKEVGVEYITIDQKRSFSDVYEELISKDDHLHIVTPHDRSFAQRLKDVLSDTEITWYASPSFVTDQDWIKNWLEEREGKRLLMADFYREQRIRLGILVDSDNNPTGGEWSYDKENRNKLKKSDPLPERIASFSSKHWSEVSKQVESLFGDHPGSLENTWLPFNREQALEYLKDFIDNALYDFGTFEDALTTRDHLVYHSGFSTALNYGLLLPEDITQAVLKVVEKTDLRTSEGKRLLYSAEGLIRQIIGWREWIKIMYDHKYTDEICQKNFFDAQEKVPISWWKLDGEGKEVKANLPLALVLNTIHLYAYAHHIERLMVLANWMTLQGYNPQESYQWFRNSFIDAFEWVMIPNVYGMGLFSDGGIFATKPYVASSNYLKNMSDFPSGDWEDVWKTAFWDFLLKHEEFFKTQPRMAMLIRGYHKRNSN